MVSQRSNDDIAVEESEFSPSIKSIGNKMVEGNKKNVDSATMIEDDHKSVDKVSTLIESTGDKDERIQY